MGEVVATVKIMPKSPDVELEEMKINAQNIINKDAELHKIEEEPIAFGLVALNVTFIIHDSEGGTAIIENKLTKLPNVSSIEIIDVRRLINKF